MSVYCLSKNSLRQVSLKDKYLTGHDITPVYLITTDENFSFLDSVSGYIGKTKFNRLIILNTECKTGKFADN
jgi:hypothetical protein